jgi:hypothetical protein
MVGDEPLAAGAVVFGQAHAHGGHDHAIAQPERAYAAGREQVRMRHRKLGSHPEGAVAVNPAI